MVYALYELSTGYSLFKVVDPDKGKFKLAAFRPFKDAKEALQAGMTMVNADVSSMLKKFLKKNLVEKSISDDLAVVDKKLGKAIKDSMGIPCIHGAAVHEMIRGIGEQINDLVKESTEKANNQAALALGHNLARYRLKFSSDKIDLMIVQAISLMDDLDKELNTYVMRVKEWYGWHFPEMQKIVKDNIQYAKVVVACGIRERIMTTDLSEILEEDVEKTLKEVAAVSMGTDIAQDDITNVTRLAKEAVELQDYREQLGEYLRHRMQAIAPNLTEVVGELIGSRLISKAGSLLQLAKHPASTVQLLGAEKALFKALKAREATPKYGLIFQTSLIQQSSKEHKGKIARVLAAKTSLAARIDSFNEDAQPSSESGHNFRDLVERRLSILDGSVGYGMKKKVKSATSSAYNREAEQGAAANPIKQADFIIDQSKDKKEKKDKKDKKEKKKRDADDADGEKEVKKTKKEKKEKKEKKSKK
eukprot:TRINITY_DN9855_c0_g1_i1.p1 TRINITY_DN9855_c0_g1~~TRINITY_DN9855_c0_g1_i1.p1  ORF type:complete len:475 (+),score=148.26 TRINITY_DN9855_c0_g1_i1:70-1494(+)